MTTNRTCITCAHLVWNGGGPLKGHPHCGHYFGPKADQLVTVDTTTCKEHRTSLERAAEKLIFTSVDDARRSIDAENRPEVLRLALDMEKRGRNRSGPVKKLNARLAKLERNKQ